MARPRISLELHGAPRTQSITSPTEPKPALPRSVLFAALTACHCRKRGPRQREIVTRSAERLGPRRNCAPSRARSLSYDKPPQSTSLSLVLRRVAREPAERRARVARAEVGRELIGPDGAAVRRCARALRVIVTNAIGAGGCEALRLEAATIRFTGTD